KPLFEDKIGHVNTLDLNLSPDGKRTLVASDGSIYLREADGAVKWRLRTRRDSTPVLDEKFGGAPPFPHENYAIDPQGRYVILASNGAITAYDLSLNVLWKFDEFDQYETTREILFGRKAYLV